MLIGFRRGSRCLAQETSGHRCFQTGLICSGEFTFHCRKWRGFKWDFLLVCERTNSIIPNCKREPLASAVLWVRGSCWHLRHRTSWLHFVELLMLIFILLFCYVLIHNITKDISYCSKVLNSPRPPEPLSISSVTPSGPSQKLEMRDLETLPRPASMWVLSWMRSINDSTHNRIKTWCCAQLFISLLRAVPLAFHSIFTLCLKLGLDWHYSLYLRLDLIKRAPCLLFDVCIHWTEVALLSIQVWSQLFRLLNNGSTSCARVALHRSGHTCGNPLWAGIHQTPEVIDLKIWFKVLVSKAIVCGLHSEPEIGETCLCRR